MPRPTITDVARAAGVSKGAVSFALNDRPGVAPDTRQRILDVAAELGWTPSSRARALSVSKALAVGLVVARPPETAAGRPVLPLLHRRRSRPCCPSAGTRCCCMVAEHGDVADLPPARRGGPRRRGLRHRPAGRRPAARAARGARPAGRGHRAGAGRRPVPPRSASTTPRASAPPSSTSSGWAHRRIAHVVRAPVDGARPLPATAWERPCATAGLPEGICVEADFSAESGAAADPRACSTSPSRPTAIVYANDLMAMAGLSLAASRGRQRPRAPVGHRLRRHRDRRPPAAVPDHGHHRRRRLGPRPRPPGCSS